MSHFQDYPESFCKRFQVLPQPSSLSSRHEQLRDLMEDKKLNFDQPLLSVRRSAPILPSKNIDAKKIGNPHPNLPRLPPNRPELKSGPITNPGSVPFHWERTPGQPKQEIKSQAPSIATLPVGPKLPPGRYRSSKNRALSVRGGENVQNVENGGGTAEETVSDSIESDGSYVDAVDVLSLTDHQSFFLNCSMSELDGLDEGEPSGNLPMNPQNRAFMMDRFLPAAKAMASASEMKPHYVVPRKQPVVVEEKPQEVKQVINPSLRYGPSFAMQCSHCDDNKDVEDSDDEYDQRSNLTAACGLLPQFYLKSSFCLLNPVPPMSVRTRASMSSAQIPEETGIDEEKTNSGNHGTATPVPSSFLEEKGDSGIPEGTGIESSASRGKASKTFQELLAEQDSSEESDSGGAVVEKILYVDTIQKVESPHLSKEQNAHETESTLSSRQETDMSVQDLKKLDDDAGGEEKSNDTCRMDMPIVFCQTVEQTVNKDSKGLERQLPRATALKQSHRLPASPPLPKSPSDSWLCRTLPSKSTKNPTLRSYLGATTNSQNHSSKALASGDQTKWETLVKTTQVQHHRQLPHSESEGLLMTIPET